MTDDIRPEAGHDHAGAPAAALAGASRMLAAAGSVQAGASDALREVAAACEADLAVLWWADEGLDRLVPAAAWRPFTAVDERVARLDARTHLGADEDAPGRVWSSGLPERSSDERGAAIAAFPIRAAAKVAGVQEAHRSVGGFAPEALAALEGLAAQLGVLARAFEAERALRETTVRYQLLVEQIPAVVYTEQLGRGLTTLYTSPTTEALLGLDREQLMAGRAVWERHVHPDDLARARREFDAGVADGRPFAVEFRVVSAAGRVVWFRDEIAVVPGDDDGPPVVHGVMLDVTGRKQAEEQVVFLASHDPLTALPNRPMLEELLELAIAKAGPLGAALSVLYLDLDDFKLVNDSLGHESGDELLRQVAARLGAATRDSDLVARQGGDEFLLLLSDLDRNGQPPAGDPGEHALSVAMSVSDRIRESLQSPFTVSGTELFVSASIGISVFPVDATDAPSLLRQAHAAMYQSKRRGPGGADVYSSEGMDASRRLSFSTRLRKAVEQQHWVMHYQPIVDLTSASMVGVEALIRWRDPAGGLIAPGEFIPLAEEIGLIEAIGDWTMHELCRQATGWRGQGVRTDVSFNLSPRQLFQPDLVPKLVDLTDRSAIDPETVVIEIIESAAMVDPERTQRILRQLSAAGFRLALDDFGTGYSSLSRLKHMRVDILKIDRSFVRDLPVDEDACSMVRAIIQLAEGMGMTPLAEGIETEPQWRFLVENGCSVGQGFLFAKPMPAASIPAWGFGGGLPAAGEASPA
jgi:diguanylate cyclase (GGDEF)-like protein/PAS domain S-box-containing protein